MYRFAINEPQTTYTQGPSRANRCPAGERHVACYKCLYSSAVCMPDCCYETAASGLWLPLDSELPHRCCSGRTRSWWPSQGRLPSCGSAARPCRTPWPPHSSAASRWSSRLLLQFPAADCQIEDSPIAAGGHFGLLKSRLQRRKAELRERCTALQDSLATAQQRCESLEQQVAVL